MSHMAVLQNATVKLFGDWKKHIWDENFIHGSGQNEETEQEKQVFNSYLVYIQRELDSCIFCKGIESLTQTLIFPLSLQIFYTTNTVFSNRSNNLSLKLLKFQRFTQSGF